MNKISASTFDTFEADQNNKSIVWSSEKLIYMLFFVICVRETFFMPNLQESSNNRCYTSSTVGYISVVLTK